MTDRCYLEVTLGLLCFEWLLVLRVNDDGRVELGYLSGSSVEWVALCDDSSRYLLSVFVGLGLKCGFLGKGI